jgi:type II secretory pathway component PulM
MASVIDRAKEWWEGKAPRERKLVLALGATLIVCTVGWVAMSIRGGLSNIEKKNDRSREALAAIEMQRILKQSQGSGQPVVNIPDSPVALDTYLDGIITEVGLKSPTYPAPKETQKGNHVELTIHVALQDLTIFQLKDLLEKVETSNPVVVVTELHVKKNFGNKENVDVDFTAATYYKKSAGGKPAAAGADKGKEG